MPDRRNVLIDELLEHPRYSREDGLIAIDLGVFPASVSLEASGDSIRYELRVKLPTLDAVVIDETVAPVVSEGWADTLELRLQDAHETTRVLESVEYAFDRTPEEIGVTIRFDRGVDADPPVEAILALVRYVEGTYLQGIIPGYEYDEPVAELLSAARGRADPDEPTAEANEVEEYGPP